MGNGIQNNNNEDIHQLDKYIKVTTPSSFVTLSALVILFIAVTVWFFWGKISDTATLKGVIFPDQGTVSVSLPNKGLVRTVFVHKGDAVTEGQQLALVSIDGSYSVVSASSNGIVLTYINEGESFEPFESIVSLLKYDQSDKINTVLAFADFTTSRELAPGQQAQVTPSYDSRERIGYISGSVSNIIPYPISRKEAEARFENKSIVDEIFPDNGAVYLVDINLEADPDNPSKLNWSFKSGCDLDTGVGTYCDIQVIVKSRSMFKYLTESINEKKHAIELWLD